MRGLPAVGGIFCKARADDVIERRRDERLQDWNRRRLVLEDGADEARLTLPLERALPGEHLVHHRAKREDVGARVGLVAFDLLRRHVLVGAENRPARGQRMVVRIRNLSGRERRGHGAHVHGATGFREPEVEEPCARLRQENVSRLEIAMHDARAVGFVERVGDFGGDLDGVAERQRAPGDAIRQRLALEILHDEKGGALVIADVVQRADVGVIELGDRPRFAIETLAELRV